MQQVTVPVRLERAFTKTAGRNGNAHGRSSNARQRKTKIEAAELFAVIYEYIFPLVFRRHAHLYKNPPEKFYVLGHEQKMKHSNSRGSFITAFCPFRHWNFQSKKGRKRVMKRLVERSKAERLVYPFVNCQTCSSLSTGGNGGTKMR